MKRITVLLALLIFSQVCIGQETANFKDDIEDPHQFTGGVSITPKLAIQFLENKELLGAKSIFGLGISGDFYYQPVNFFTLKTGLGLNYYGAYGERDYSLLFGCDNVGGVSDPFNSFTETQARTLYLGIPIEGRIKLVGDENHLFTSVGVESWLRILTKTRTKIHECGIPSTGTGAVAGKIVNQRQGLVLLTYGLGYEIGLNQGRSLFFEPRLEYSLTSPFSNPDANLSTFSENKFLNLGLRIGMKV